MPRKIVDKGDIDISERHAEDIARMQDEAVRDSDPVLRALMQAPVDDEPESEEEKFAVAEGTAALARGDVLSDEEMRSELDL